MLRPLLLLLMLFITAGCSGEDCYDADDFGFANLVVSSRYTKEEMEDQQGENQVAPWVDSTYRVNGRPLAILVRHWDYVTNRNTKSEVSAWCPWFGDVGDEHKLSDFCHRLQDCFFIDNQMCTNTADAGIGNAPCILRKGVGLYALISEKGNDPNISFSSMRDPDGISMHLGIPPSGYKMLDITKKGEIKNAGGRVYLYDNGSVSADSLKQTYVDGKLYFKILDKYYDDNSGQYRVSIKSGVHAVNPDPISYVTKLIKEFMFGTGGDDYGLIQRIYQGVIENEGYRLAVSALLTLYIMYTGLAYLTGNVELSHTELILRVGKIAIISALISTEQSWSFFYNYLFAFFVGGVEQILQMIMSAGASGPGASGILAMMIAPQTMAKLFALLFVDWRGFIYIILFFLALFFVLKVFFDAAVIYLTALLAVGLIIVMAPIFICFLLFGFTRSLFENWLRQLISYAVQPIILFTGLVFISFILREEIYGSLGFRVCKHFFPALSEEADLFGELTEDTLGVNLGRSPFYWWFPEPMKGSLFTRDMITIPIPIDHFDTNGDFCEAYGCFGLRYPDLPFLDPNTDRGTSRISRFHNGEFVQLDGLLLIFIALYMLSKFNTLTISMAKFITSTSGNFVDIGKVQKSATSGKYHSVSSFRRVMGREFRKTSGGRMLNDIQTFYRGQKAALKALPAKVVDKYALKRLRKQALSSEANKSVLAEVEKNTGLKQSDVIKGSSKRYQEAIAKNLLEMDNTLTRTQAKKIAKAMSKTDYKKMHEEFARAKYGVEFDKLSKQEQAQIRELMNRRYGEGNDAKSLRELAIDSKNERRFRKAYVDAHQDMSNRGIGVFGKSNSAIRSYDEFKHDYKKRKKDKKAERRMTGERIMSGIEGVKSGAYEAATGQREDTKRDLGKKYFGGGYHDIDRTDPGLRTYDEILKEQRDNVEREKIDRKIDAINQKEGTSVVSPEFIARRRLENDPNLGGYQELSRQGVENQVHRELTTGRDPILKGTKYMMNYAKDSELVEMVDRAQTAKETIFENDQFISREDDYELKAEKAKAAIEKDIKDFKEAFGDRFNAEQMPKQLEIYMLQNGYSRSEIDKAVNNLKNNLAEYKQSQQVLQQIDERKYMVTTEVDKAIDDINEARVASGMEEYTGQEKGVYVVRRERKIEDYLVLSNTGGSDNSGSGSGSSSAPGSGAPGGVGGGGTTGGVTGSPAAVSSGFGAVGKPATSPAPSSPPSPAARPTTVSDAAPGAPTVGDKAKDPATLKKEKQKIKEQERRDAVELVKAEKKKEKAEEKAYQDAIKTQTVEEKRRRELEERKKKEERRKKNGQ